MKMKNRLLITCLLVIAPMFSVFADNEITDRLQVVGKATLKAIPENFEVSIQLMEKDSFYASCTQKLFDTTHKLQADLGTIGINHEIVKTDNYSIDENFVYKNNQRIKEGYVGRMLMQISDTYTPETLGKIIEVLKSNQILFTIRFALSERQKEEMNELAIKKAVADAKAKAEILEKQAGIKVHQITKIIYDYSGFIHDELVQNRAEHEITHDIRGQANTFSPREISIEKKVFIEWFIVNGKRNYRKE